MTKDLVAQLKRARDRNPKLTILIEDANDGHIVEAYGRTFVLDTARELITGRLKSGERIPKIHTVCALGPSSFDVARRMETEGRCRRVRAPKWFRVQPNIANSRQAFLARQLAESDAKGFAAAVRTLVPVIPNPPRGVLPDRIISHLKASERSHIHWIAPEVKGVDVKVEAFDVRAQYARLLLEKGVWPVEQDEGPNPHFPQYVIEEKTYRGLRLRQGGKAVLRRGDGASGKSLTQNGGVIFSEEAKLVGSSEFHRRIREWYDFDVVEAGPSTYWRLGEIPRQTTKFIEELMRPGEFIKSIRSVAIGSLMMLPTVDGFDSMRDKRPTPALASYLLDLVWRQEADWVNSGALAVLADMCVEKPSRRQASESMRKVFSGKMRFIGPWSYTSLDELTGKASMRLWLRMYEISESDLKDFSPGSVCGGHPVNDSIALMASRFKKALAETA